LIDSCLTTLSQKCPICEHNSGLWNSGSDRDKEEARKQKRKLSYYANIYVVKDPANPQNEGKVFLYKFGKKIFDKITAAMQPEFDDEEPINPFDFWSGANFKLKLVKKDGYWNYDKSEFASPSVLLDDDDELESIYKSLTNLNEFTDSKNFKSYDELKKRLDLVLGLRSTSKSQDSELIGEEDDWGASEEKEQSFDKVAKASSPKSKVEEDDDEDDALSYFQKLAES